jgi:hypothetical protein
LNVTAYYRHDTLEIRNHHATLSGDEIIRWVKVHLAWFAYCRDNRVPRGLTTREQWEVVKEAIGANLAASYAAMVEPYLSPVRELVNV